MRKMLLVLLVVASGVALVGCSRFSRGYRLGAPRQATSPASITVIEGAPEKPYEVVAKVHGHCRKNWFFGWGASRRSKMVGLLKNEAARLGANAIMDIQRESFSQFEWSDVHYHATAIRWK